MTREVLSYIGGAAAGAVVVLVALRLFWRAVGYYKVRRAGPRPLFGVRHKLWRDPGRVEALDVTAGPGGPSQAPAPPFRFIEEHTTGSQPCVSVHDANGRRWRGSGPGRAATVPGWDRVRPPRGIGRAIRRRRSPQRLHRQ